MNPTIHKIRARGVAAPIKRPPAPASGSISEAALVLIDVETSEGVTGRSYLFTFLRQMLGPTADVVEALGLELSSHLFPEFGAHLLAVSPTGHWLEYMDWANAILKEPYRIADGHVVIPDRPGAGIEWNEEAVEKYLVRA